MGACGSAVKQGRNSTSGARSSDPNKKIQEPNALTLNREDKSAMRLVTTDNDDNEGHHDRAKSGEIDQLFELVRSSQQKRYFMDKQGGYIQAEPYSTIMNYEINYDAKNEEGRPISQSNDWLPELIKIVKTEIERRKVQNNVFVEN